MKRLIEKIWLLSAALCLIAMLSAFVAVIASHQIAEETSTELVEIEECDAVTHRGERRLAKKEMRPAFRYPARSIKANLNLSPRDSSFRPVTERDHLNGFGGYLSS